MNKKIIVMAILVMGIQLVMNTILLYAQSKKDHNKKIILSSNPNGAYVQMKGEYIIRGRTPFEIPYGLKGYYKIKAQKYGYENWSTFYDFSDNEKGSFYFTLDPKTRFKAGLRSFLFPGWGQYYSDRKFQGALLAGVQLASALYTIKKDSDYNHIVSDYQNMQDKLKIERLTFEERKELREEIKEKEKEADQAYEDRQKWIYISAAIWAYNVLDAVFFFSYDKMRATREMYPSLSARSDGTQTTINLKWDF